MTCSHEEGHVHIFTGFSLLSWFWQHHPGVVPQVTKLGKRIPWSQTPLTSADSAHKLLWNPLGPVRVPFLNLTLTCSVGGRVYHPLWEPEKALNLLQPCSPKASWAHGNDRTCSPAPGLSRTLSPLISDPCPILGPFFSLIQASHPGLPCWLPLPSPRMARRHPQGLSVLLKPLSAYQHVRWAWRIQQGSRWYTRGC